MLEWIQSTIPVFALLPEAVQAVIVIMIKILVITLPLMLCVAYLTFAERKIISAMQVRMGPTRVGPRGWLQPIADAVKLMFKEIIIPSGANKYLFLLAPKVKMTSPSSLLIRSGT